MGIAETWGKSTEITTSDPVVSAAQALEGNTVKARYDRDGKQVLILFNVLDGPSARGVLSGRVAEYVGDRLASQIISDTVDNRVLLRVPAQVYVDKLEGVVPGLKRQVGGGA
jgi:hypothetical protein